MTLPLPVIVTVTFAVSDPTTNPAVTLCAEFIVSVQFCAVPKLAQAPVHPLKLLPAFGHA